MIYGNTLMIVNNKTIESKKIKQEKVISNDLDFLLYPNPTMTGLLVRKECLYLMNTNDVSWGEDLLFFHRMIYEKTIKYYPIDVGIYHIFTDSRGAGSVSIKPRLKLISNLFKDMINRKSIRSKLNGLLYCLYFTLRTLIALFYKKVRNA